MSRVDVADWVAAHPLSPTEIDCATTVMLKILDGKCKMQATEKVVMTALYDAVRPGTGNLFDAAVHTLIDRARQQADGALRDHIYEQRVLAETTLSRPVMKAFKARIRAEGLFNGNGTPETTPPIAAEHPA